MKGSRTLVLAISALVGQVSADGGETFDRIGRLWGYGWSDGYHACSADGFHFGENLPPRSFAPAGPGSAMSQHYGGTPVLGFRSAEGCDERFIDRGAGWTTVPSEPEEVVVPPAAAAPTLPSSPQEAVEPLPAPPAQPVPTTQGNRGRSGFPRKLNIASPVRESAKPSLPVPGPTQTAIEFASPSRLPLTDRVER